VLEVVIKLALVCGARGSGAAGKCRKMQENGKMTLPLFRKLKNDKTWKTWKII
jgi:hypothetical protein